VVVTRWRSISSAALLARPALIAPQDRPGRDLDDALRPQRDARLADRGPAQRELLGQVAFGHHH
jgi:hypothetical protein